jgi:hypothetical protein
MKKAAGWHSMVSKATASPQRKVGVPRQPRVAPRLPAPSVTALVALQPTLGSAPLHQTA